MSEPSPFPGAQAASAARRQASLFDHVVDFAVIATDRSGDITDWNKGAERLFGWQPSEMRGQSLTRIFTDEDCQTGHPRSAMASSLETGHTHGERWHLRKDGTRFWAITELLPMRDEGGAHLGFLKMLHDGTARLAAAEQQRADGEFLKGVLGASADCIAVLDLDGNLDFMNESGQRQMDVADFASVRGRPWIDFWAGPQRAEADTALTLARSGQAGQFQGPAATLAGHVKWWNVQVTPIAGATDRPERLLAVARDVTAAHRAEQLLYAAQGLNALILESSRDCIVVMDMEARTQYVSPGGIISMEIDDVQPILGLSWLRVWHDHDQEAVRAAVSEAQAGGVGRFQGYCPTHKGTPKWWDVVISPLRGSDGAPERLVSIGRDITKLKKVEATLHDVKMRLESTLTAGEVATWIWHIDTDQVFADRNLARLFNVSEADASGGPLSAYVRNIHPDDAPAVAALIQAAIDAGSPFDTSYRVMHADGTYHWLIARGRVERDASGRPTRLPGVVLDATRLKVAEEALRESEERYRNLFNAMDEGFCVIEIIFDAHGQPIDYLHVEMNPAFVSLTGLTNGLGKRVREIVPDIESHWIEVYGRVAMTGEATRFINEAAGLGRWFDVYATRLGPATSHRVAVLFTNITEKKRAEDDLRRLAADLSEMDRRKTEFLATLAHELRNPLAPLRNGLEVMRRHADNVALIGQARAIMERQLGQLVHLVNDLLDVARITSGKIDLDRRPVDLRTVVETAIETSMPRIEAGGHQLVVQLPDEPLAMHVDAIRIAQVLTNLLNNAAKYTASGGRIHISATRDAGDAVLCVTDNGVGIPADSLSTVFDMFSQVSRHLHRADGGLGIGLALVRKVVEMHHGSVTATSAGVGLGSTFTVRLPAPEERKTDADNHAETANAALAALPASRKLNVLVADDNIDGAESLSLFVRLAGHNTRVAHDGHEALAIAAEFRPDIMFLDIGMPRLNGYETARRIRALPGLKQPMLVAVTGWGTEADRARTHEAGFDEHLVKPADGAPIEALLQKLK